MIISVVLPRLQPFPGGGSRSSVRMSSLTALRMALGKPLLHPQHFSSLQQRCPLLFATKKRVFLNYGWKVFGCSGFLSTRSLFVIGLSDLTHLIKNYLIISRPVHTLPQFLTVVQSYKTIRESNNWQCLQTKVSY